MHAIASILQSALTHNLSIVRMHAPSAKIVCMVKANAYGHHLELSSPLMQADMLAVSELSEVRRLRKLCNKPILLLPGVFNKADLQEAITLNCHLVLHDFSQIDIINQTEKMVNIWIKVDTGMHRLGIAPNQLETCLSQLEQNKNIKIECIMSHFACADEPEHNQNIKQLDAFTQLKTKQINRSMANSAAILSLPKSHFDYVRPGIMLYGVSPFSSINKALIPVMELSAPVIALKTIKTGESVGYGATWKAKKESHIAIIGIGYGDGYPRHAKSGTPILINNTLCSLIGCVSMDLIAVDIGTLSIKINDRAILWGHDKLRIETVASYSNTISYELLTGVTNRVEFIQRG